MKFVHRKSSTENAAGAAEETVIASTSEPEDVYGGDWVAKISDNFYDRVDAVKPVIRDEEETVNMYGTPLWVERASRNFSEVRAESGADEPEASASFKQYEERYQLLLDAVENTVS